MGNAPLYIIIPSFVIILGILIFVHELGHFLSARLFRIRVETFSLGFGKRLFGFRRNGTDYRISAIPLGGYLKMAGEYIGEVRSGVPDEFLSKPRYQRAIVMVSGVAMNFFLALALITSLFMIGVEIPAYTKSSPQIGAIVKDSPAEKGGLQVRDTILRMNNQPTPNWEALMVQSNLYAHQTIPVTFSRNGTTHTTSIHLPDAKQSNGQFFGVYPFLPARVKKVYPDGPAARAGLQAGDEIIHISSDGNTEEGAYGIQKLMSKNTGSPVLLSVRRAGKTLALTALPVMNPRKPGTRALLFEYRIDTIREKYNFQAAFVRAFEEIVRFTQLTVDVFSQILAFRASVFNAVSGPIDIAVSSGNVVQTGDVTQIFSFIALISLNLAIVNLMPIPFLDGGMMLILLVEIGIRRDLPMKWKERAVQVGFLLLMTLMVVIVSMDILKFIGFKR